MCCHVGNESNCTSFPQLFPSFQNIQSKFTKAKNDFTTTHDIVSFAILILLHFHMTYNLDIFNF